MKKRCEDPLDGNTVPRPTSLLSYPVELKSKLYGLDDEYTLVEPVNQSIPIVLPINDTQKALLEEAGKRDRRKLPLSIRLLYKGRLVAVLEDPEVFPHRC